MAQVHEGIPTTFPQWIHLYGNWAFDNTPGTCSLRLTHGGATRVSMFHICHPKHILARYGVEAKKSLGQNFLFDDNLLRKIVDIAEVSSTDHVLEVGAGLGSLTSVLAESAETVTAIELDNRLIPILNAQFREQPNVNINAKRVFNQTTP